MRVSEKTLELTLCCQLGWLHHRWHWPPFLHGPQPIWFGLTQQQEARAGFDAAARLGNRRILLLQFKAGSRLQSGAIRFQAPHQQLQALQARIRNQQRLLFYVLPEVTRTRELNNHGGWVLTRTWFLDVASIPALSPPTRRSQRHHLTLDVHGGIVTITSDPVDVGVTKGSDLVDTQGWSSLGGMYENFEKFWSCAGLLRRGAVAAALPNATA